MDQNGIRNSILVVDDSGVARKRIQQLLRAEGCTVAEATSGLAALAILQKTDFDCIFTDLLMPEMDGFGLLEELRKRRCPTPVVVVSADVQKTTRQRCEELGAALFLQKPASPETVREALGSVLPGYQKTG